MDSDTCKAAIKAAYKAQQQQQNSDTTTTQLASDIVDAIVALIESGNVNFSSGSVNGTCGGAGNPLTAGSATNGKMT